MSKDLENFWGVSIMINFLQKIKRLLLRLWNSPENLHLLYKAWMKDEDYIRELYFKRFQCYPNLENPSNFNEKNNWRKLHDRNPLYTRMVDKYMVKKVISERVGEEFTFPLIGVWDSPKEIDFSTLPDQFVLKNNHSGGVIICRDPSEFDRKRAVQELAREMRANYFWGSREWPYKNVPRKIICEQYMGENLIDYKNYCFNGKLQYTFVWRNQGREDGRKPMAYFCGAYDRNWEKSGIEIDYPSQDVIVEKPECYDEMVRVAEAMAADIPFVRVDCYIVNNRVYVGEMTFFPWGGFMKFKDEKWNQLLGDLEVLPKLETQSNHQNKGL